MKGYMIKDMCLLAEQKSRWIVIIVIAGAMSFTFTSPMFIVSYLTLIASVLVLSTISYDEYDNGLPFLMTLPATRKQYVQEKYVLSLLFTLTGWGISVIMQLALDYIKTGNSNLLDMVPGSIAVLPLGIAVIAFMLPIQIKYGSEKGKPVMFAMGGILALVIVGIGMIARNTNLDVDGIIAEINNVGALGLGIILYAIIIAVCLLSYGLSLRFFNKKQF